jgi:hypothetical protein
VRSGQRVLLLFSFHDLLLAALDKDKQERDLIEYRKVTTKTEEGVEIK